MNIRAHSPFRHSGLSFVLATALGVGGCGAATEETSSAPEADIDVAPQTFDAATASLTQIAALQAKDPSSQRARDALRQVEARLDVLNHLVARVETSPGHVVSFYEGVPGMVSVAEKGPRGNARVLAGPDMQKNPVEVYRTLAGGAEPPAALLQAQARAVAAENAPVAETAPDAAQLFAANEEGFGTNGLTLASSDTAKVTSALTADDGPWFQDNGCFKHGDARGCLPNWANGGYAQYNAKTSFLTIAPYSGDWVQVRWQYKGTTIFTDTVYVGQWNDYYGYSAGASCATCGYYVRQVQKHRWDILQASGDGFHWSYSFKWASSCIDQECDAFPW